MFRSITRRLFAGAIAGAAVALSACATAPATTPAPIDGVSFRMVETNGITLRVAEMGEGPLVVLVHGWPESWYSWRHQIPVIAAAGYKVIAPDMRGFGGSDKPPNVDDYDVKDLSGDIVGLLDAYGAEKAIIIGHDWGSIATWNSVLLHPDRFSAMIAMSVPNGGRGTSSPMAAMRAANGENFYYILYHQEPGVAEAEYKRRSARPAAAHLRADGCAARPAEDHRPQGVRRRLDTPSRPAEAAAGLADREGPRLLLVRVRARGLPGRRQLLPEHRAQLGDHARTHRRAHQGPGRLHRGHGRHRYPWRQGARTTRPDDPCRR
jgi:pimeloyl-ACP methyl ester carboxylesterase